jgi:putative membrane protein
MSQEAMQRLIAGMGDGMMSGGMTAFAWFWAAFAVVVLAVAVVGLVWLVRTMTRSPGGTSGDGAARAELDLRYARGDLTREEYLQRRADLEGGRP